MNTLIKITAIVQINLQSVKDYDQQLTKITKALGCSMPVLIFEWETWVLILCFSYFEIKLIKVCKDELEDRDLSTEPSEFRSNDFDNVFKGTLKIVDIRFETISKKWGEIKNIQKVRNVIVHSNGRVIGSISEEQVRKYIGKRDDITIERGRIILSKEFCLYVLNTVKLFLDNFIDLLINTSSSTSPSIM